MAVALVAAGTVANNTGTGATMTVTVPGTAAAGQLAVLLFVDGASSLTNTQPAGWVAIPNTHVATTTGGVDAWSKVLVSGDVGATLTITTNVNGTSAVKRAAQVLVYSGATLGDSDNGTVASATTSRPCPAVTATSASAWVLNLAMDRASPGSTSFTLPANLRSRGTYFGTGGAAPSMVTADDDLVGSGTVGANNITGTISTGNVITLSIVLEPTVTGGGGTPPVGTAPANQSNIEAGSTVTLVATDSATGPATVTRRQWTQTGGPLVAMINPATATLSFLAPPSITDTTLTFSYQVTDSTGLTSTPSTVTVGVLRVTERFNAGGTLVPFYIRLNNTTPPVRVRPNTMGVSIGAGDLLFKTQAWVDSRLDEVSSLGGKWLRTDLNWSWIEPTLASASDDSIASWEWWDYLVVAAKQRGINLLFTLGTMPSWARPSGQPEIYGPTTTTEQQDFTDWVTRAVNRYSGDVEYWELWNEANLDQFWAPTPSVVTYTNLLKKVYPAIKAADSTATVLASGSGGAGSSPDIASTTWWTGIYANTGKAFFDIANHHPYPDNTQIPSLNYNTAEMANAATIRTTMNANGDSAKPLWATECGLPTSGTPSVTEAQQTTGLAGLRTLWFSRESNTKFFIYSMRDRAAVGTTGATRESFFGVTRSDGTAKPAFADEQTWTTSA